MTAQDISLSRRPHPVDRLWRSFLGDRLFGLVLALLALSGLALVLLPQTPPEAVQQGTTFRWLAETSMRYGGLGAILQQVGLFDVRDSTWFHGLLGLLAFLLLLRLAQSAGDGIDRLRQQDPERMAVQSHRWPLRAHFDTESSPQVLADELVADLSNEGWQVVAEVTEDTAWVIAERSTVGLLAAPLIYAGLILVLAALWLGWFSGWQEVGLTLVPGEQTRLAYDGQWALSFAELEDGSPAVAVQGPDGTTQIRAFSAAGRARVAGMMVQRTGEGLAVTVSGRDDDGNPVQLQPLEERATSQPALNLVFDQPRAERAFLAPERQLAFSIVAFPALPERGYTSPTFLIQAFRVGRREPLFNQFVEQEAGFVIAGDRFSLSSGGYVTVRVSRNPGTPLIWIGGLLATLGGLLGLLRPAAGLTIDLQRRRQTTRATARLLPSLAWRQGARWLAAWSGTYTQESVQENQE